MKEKDHQQEERQPGRVEERHQPHAAEERAQRIHVPQSVEIRGAAQPRRLREQAVEHAWPEAAVERDPGRREQTRAQDVEQRHDEERHDRRDGQNEERLAAAAREHAIEHLQHVQRRNQQQQIDRQAEQPGVEKERPKSSDESAHATFYSTPSLPLATLRGSSPAS
jgi:hypothetical protein